MIVIILVSSLFGMILTLVIQYIWIQRWFSSLPEEPIPKKPQFGKFHCPEELFKLPGDGNGKFEKESCRFLNLIFQFLFKELRDTREVRRWVAKRMSMEFEDMLQTTSGKFLEQIVVRDFNLGTRFPTFHSVIVKNEIKDSALEMLEIALDIEYSGGFQMAVDVDLMFGKSAYLSITVTKLVGKARLLFTRDPYTHWNFAFYEEPHMEFEVEPRIEGKSFPQITSFIINQIKRVVKKKHTLPNYKIRFRPFFFKPETLHPQADFYIHGVPLGVGWLDVNIIGCSRLAKIPSNVALFCTVSLSFAEMKGINIKRKTWMNIDIEITKGHNQPVGLLFKEGVLAEHEEEVVMVDCIQPDSPAEKVDIKKNDILVSLGTTKITSVKQAVKLTKNAGERLTLHLRRQQHRATQPSEPRFEDEPSEKSEESLDSEYTLTDNKTWEEMDSEVKSSDRSCKKDSHGLCCPELTHRRLSKNSLDKVEIQIQPADKNDPRRLEVRNLDPGRLENRSPVVSPKRLPQVKSSQLNTQMEPPPIIMRKSSKGEEDQLDAESLLEFEDEEEMSEVCRTRLVSASQNPCWNEQFEFEVEEEHRFLNICLWCREPDKIDKHDKVTKRRKNVRIGHVSFLLSEIALDCLTTVQGDTQKTRPLIPAEPKPGAIRTRCSTLASHPGFEPQLCHGDITVSFFFQPTEKVSENHRKRLSKTTIQPNMDEPINKELADKPECSKPNISNALSYGSDGFPFNSDLVITGNHKFVVNCTPYQSASYCCVFCARKIWMGRGFKCNVCGMIVHKKCTDKCQEKTLCTREGPRNRAVPDEPWKPMTTQQAENQKNKVQDEKDNPSRAGGLLSKFRKDSAPTGKKNLAGRNCRSNRPPEHTCLMAPPMQSPKMQRKKSLPETQSSINVDPSKLQTTASGLPRTRSSTSLQVLLLQNASPTLQPHEVIVKHEEKSDNSDDSDSGGSFPNCKSKVMMNVSNFDEEIVTNAKEKGKELLSHLSLEERKEKLDTMVSMVQEQIDQVTEYKVQLTRKEKSINDAAMKKVYQAEIRITDEQNERLMMQLLHYCAGLQHCLDQQEEERQKVEQAQPPIHPISSGLQSSPLPMLSISVVPPLMTEVAAANNGSTNDDAPIGNGGHTSDEDVTFDCGVSSHGDDLLSDVPPDVTKYPQMSVIVSPPPILPSTPSPTTPPSLPHHPLLNYKQDEEEEEAKQNEEQAQQQQQQLSSSTPSTSSLIPSHTPSQDHLLPVAEATATSTTTIQHQPLLLSSSSSSSLSSTSPATAAWLSLSSSSSSLPSSFSSSSAAAIITTTTPTVATATLTTSNTTVTTPAPANTAATTSTVATTASTAESEINIIPTVLSSEATESTTTINLAEIADKQLNIISKPVECSDS
ncbi:PDZ domain-containing protein 8-like [Argonauta hians]